MEASQQTLASLLALAALIAGTIEYAEVLQRRRARRQALIDRDLMHEAGVRGLVRIAAMSERP
jgi:hypothetical protein